MTAQSPKYWFPAKRYGWGWGLPCAWQGWVVLAAYIGSVIALTRYLRGADLVLMIVPVTLVFIIVCWLKGEPAHWRWGSDR